MELRRVAANLRVNLYHQAKRRDALQAADVRSLNATAHPVIDADPAEPQRLSQLADALDVK